MPPRDDTDSVSRVKPYKLQTPVTRDGLVTWNYNMKAFTRHNKAWRPFLPAGTKNTWTATRLDPTNGLSVRENGIQDDNKTQDLRDDFANFLTCVATHCPPNFFSTVMEESTSYQWIIDMIERTFNLQTKGEHFLRGTEIKVEYGPEGSTYGQGYMQYLDFYRNTLLKTGDRYQGVARTSNEELTPLAKHFIIEKWLQSIDVRLPGHILRTRGSLFTADRPHLGCNQEILADQIPTLMAELEAAEATSNHITVGQIGPTRGGYRGITVWRGRGGRAPGRGSYAPRAPTPPAVQGRQQQYGYGPSTAPTNCPPDMCYKCHRAGRGGPQTRQHIARNCPYSQTSAQPYRGGPNRTAMFMPPAGYPAVQYIQAPQDYVDYYQDMEYDYSRDQQDDEPTVEEYQEETDVIENTDIHYYPPPLISAVPTETIQNFTFLYEGRQAQLSLDSGAEADCMETGEARRLGIPICPLEPNDKQPYQADGQTKLRCAGKAVVDFMRDGLKVRFHGYVIDVLSRPILCGKPFLRRNSVVLFVEKRLMVVKGRTIMEDPTICPSPLLPFRVQTVDTNPSHLQTIEIGDRVPGKQQARLKEIHCRYQEVFNNDLRLPYNGASGNFDVDFDFHNDIPPPPHRGTVPTYAKQEELRLLQAKIDKLEEEGIVAKTSDLGVTLKYASPCMLTMKLSARQISKDDWQAMDIEEKLKHVRFVMAMNKLCNHVNKKPAMTSKLDDTITMVGSHEFIITSDLKDSFWQRKITPAKIPYFGFHGPFGQDYVFLRSCQGFLNQSEELEQLVQTVLKQGVTEGWTRVHADNIYIMGNNIDETIARWERTLQAMRANNLKLSPAKTQCMPNSLDLLGWKKQGKYLIPDPHRQNTLVTAELPVTVKDLRSYLGSYNTFYRCKPKVSQLLQNLSKLTATAKQSSSKVPWTEELVEEFKMSQKEAKTMDRLYIPKPSDQLVQTQDYCEKGTQGAGGISATLWAITGIEQTPEVVARFSAPVQPRQKRILPCDGEAMAAYVAAKSPVFSVPIRASEKKTISLVDSKPVYEASNLLKRGKFSASRIINQVLASISDLNLEFQHVSGKYGRNFPDDFASRNSTNCDEPEKCSICSFISECEGMPAVASIQLAVSRQAGTLVGQIASIKAGETIKDIITGRTRLPLDNKQAMTYLQQQDKTLQRVRDLLQAGQRPNIKRDKRAMPYFRKDLNITIDKEGCIIVNKPSSRHLGIRRRLLVVPEEISRGLLTSLHINLQHPTQDQLHKVVDTRFFILDISKKCRDVSDACTTCASLRSLPTEKFKFKENIVPNHPGEAFTVDVLREAGKIIIVAACNFSGYLSTAIIQSERTEDLTNGIVTTVLPFKSTSLATIRVDRAPGFNRLANQTETLAELGIVLQQGEAKNKNSCAIVDERMRELRKALRAVSPSTNVVNLKTLAKATAVVNERIRHYGMSAKEVLFARDQISSENLPIEDTKIVECVTNIRKVRNEKLMEKNEKLMEKKQVPQQTKAVRGQLVFLRDEGTKQQSRETYMVISTNEKEKTLKICKLKKVLTQERATMQPQNYTYMVRQEAVTIAPNQPTASREYQHKKQSRATEEHTGRDSMEQQPAANTQQPEVQQQFHPRRTQPPPQPSHSQQECLPQWYNEGPYETEAEDVDETGDGDETEGEERDEVEGDRPAPGRPQSPVYRSPPESSNTGVSPGCAGPVSHSGERGGGTRQ